MTKIALVGGAKSTRGAVHQSQADELWTPNWSYKYDYVPRIDRLFEMHPVWLYADTDKATWAKPREHWDWLQQAHPYPIYMLKEHPSVPASVRYPIEDVVREIFPHLKRKNWEEGTLEPARFFTSSFDYMLGLAILMKDEWNIDEIETFGVEMGSDTEYRYQKYGASFFIGVAITKGIRITMPHNTVLTKGKLYGYEGAQMIFRTDLERYLTMYNEMRVEYTSILNHMEGQYSVYEQTLRNMVAEHGVEHQLSQDAAKALEEQRGKVQDQRDMVSIAAGAFQAVKYLVDEVDLDIPEVELQNIWNEVKFDDHGVIEPEVEGVL
jgi:hypothetical protein